MILTGLDAAWPPIGAAPKKDVLFVYYGGGTPHVWTDTEVAEMVKETGARFIVPIYVRVPPTTYNARIDATIFIDKVATKGQPKGTMVALDYETAINPWWMAFEDAVMERGYKLCLYGTLRTVVQNIGPNGRRPSCGYWSAHWTNVFHVCPDTGVKLTQYGGDTTLGKPYDLSAVPATLPLWDLQGEDMAIFTDAEHDELMKAARNINGAVGSGQLSFETTVESILATVQSLVNIVRAGDSSLSNLIGQTDDVVVAAVATYLAAHPVTADMTDMDKQAILDGVDHILTNTNVKATIDPNMLLDALNQRLVS